ncbi:hypothetical protein SAMN05216228_107415 [Rhizobium tibeticum]|uniref:Uncharacterized protein n=1 Tax=Rhizobium tibeticum TaxID=501024 RepID=A0A1H8WSF4_9HYPH|nr:hypothetical protein RTCCBAU85039_6664 [Rhizobium tibeticum]SEP30018.1 hypothetical protein SAMN05216228_107415 [Rhizobium tibeticum]
MCFAPRRRNTCASVCQVPNKDLQPHIDEPTTDVEWHGVEGKAVERLFRVAMHLGEVSFDPAMRPLGHFVFSDG